MQYAISRIFGQATFENKARSADVYYEAHRSFFA